MIFVCLFISTRFADFLSNCVVVMHLGHCRNIYIKSADMVMPCGFQRTEYQKAYNNEDTFPKINKCKQMFGECRIDVNNVLNRFNWRPGNVRLKKFSRLSE